MSFFENGIQPDGPQTNLTHLTNPKGKEAQPFQSTGNSGASHPTLRRRTTPNSKESPPDSFPINNPPTLQQSLSRTHVSALKANQPTRPFNQGKLPNLPFFAKKKHYLAGILGSPPKSTVYSRQTPTPTAKRSHVAFPGERSH